MSIQRLITPRQCLTDGIAAIGVLDKGTLDALLCGDAAEDDADRMLREVSRVLQPGGVYLMITSQAPQGRYR